MCVFRAHQITKMNKLHTLNQNTKHVTLSFPGISINHNFEGIRKLDYNYLCNRGGSIWFHYLISKRSIRIADIIYLVMVYASQTRRYQKKIVFPVLIIIPRNSRKENIAPQGIDFKQTCTVINSRTCLCR